MHAKIHIPNLPTGVVVRTKGKIILLLPTLTSSLGLRFWYFNINFLAHGYLCVDNMCEKFQGQEMYSKEDIQNLLSLGIDVRKVS